METPKVEEKTTSEEMTEELMDAPEEKAPESIDSILADGSSKEIKNALADLTLDDVNDAMTDEEWKALLSTFGQTLNNQKCPCGSGENFEGCCKHMWTMVRRLRESRESRERARKKEEKKTEKMQEDVVWLMKLGLRGDGATVIGGLSPKMETMRFTDLLKFVQSAWIEILAKFLQNMTTGISREMVMQAFKEIDSARAAAEDEKKIELVKG